MAEKFSICENHKLTFPRSSRNPKQDKHKHTFIHAGKAHHKQITENSDKEKS